MADVKVPELGESIDSAEVLKVLVSEGDSVEVDQPVIELESDKASIEMPSPNAGKVQKIHVSAGDEVQVGQTVLTLGEAGQEAEADANGEAAEGEEAEDADAIEARGKKAGRKKNKDKKKKKKADKKKARKREAKAAEDEDEDEDTEAAEDEDDDADAEDEDQDEDRAEAKADGEEPAEAAGEDEDQPRAQSEPETEAEAQDRVAARRSRRGNGHGSPVTMAAGPATRRLARELGVEIDDIRASGPGGRVTREDVKRYVRDHGGAGGDEPQPAASAATPDASAAARPASAEDERERLTRLERTAAEHLQRAWTEIPHVTHHDLADVTELEGARRRFAEREQDVKLTVTAIAVKAAVAALRAYPRMNASLDADAQELVLHRRYHIGVAVDTERGLLVPVVRDADRKTLREIAAAIETLAAKARDRKLSNEEMRGGTFSITNVGGIGGTSFTPIIHAPQVAILGIARARTELVRDDRGELSDRLRLPLSLSYDHRVINGADAARFTRLLSSLLEEPLNLLMEC